MSKRLEGKIVIVTGAGRGVGRGVALAMAISCNVLDQEQVKQTLDTVVEKWGTVDIMVNNAQASRVKTFEHMTADDLHLAYSTGTLSTFFFMQGVFPVLLSTGNTVKQPMQRQKKRFVGINVNLICPFANSPGMIAWSQAEPQAYEASLAKLPIKRIGDCEMDIGRTAVFLASKDSDYITGQTIMVDGGGVMVR
ncbi:SDR family NAD(P)-dependent oxidoreductase [Brevibacillus invocatus]|uniref:SDR family NAD(P)-dependent oxidoreductase n=1 Tax=Brevibacillus invocatus TaxID=173959 RepID=UPI001FE3931C|nr:SDR family oxidoreductase [Brevibacillus invocatus]